MPEISIDDLHGMHANLTAAGVGEYATITSDISRLAARIDVARDRILILATECDALREQANAAHAALLDAQAENAALRFGLDEVEQALGSALAERDAACAAHPTK